MSGSGGTDNASFTISGGTLQTAAMFDFEAKNSYGVRIRSTDQGGLWFEKAFTISVLNVAEAAPTITGISSDSGSSSSDGITSDSTLLLNGTSEPGMTITVYRGGVLAGQRRPTDLATGSLITPLPHWPMASIASRPRPAIRWAIRPQLLQRRT